jgi:hypothetical protein
VVRDGLGAVVRDVAHGDAARGGGVDVYRVHADAVASDRPEPGECVHDLPVDAGVLHQYAVGVEAGIDQLCSGAALADPQVDAARARYGLLLQERVVVALGHRDDGWHGWALLRRNACQGLGGPAVDRPIRSQTYYM